MPCVYHPASFGFAPPKCRDFRRRCQSTKRRGHRSLLCRGSHRGATILKRFGALSDFAIPMQQRSRANCFHGLAWRRRAWSLLKRILESHHGGLINTSFSILNQWRRIAIIVHQTGNRHLQGRRSSGLWLWHFKLYPLNGTYFNFSGFNPCKSFGRKRPFLRMSSPSNHTSPPPYSGR